MNVTKCDNCSKEISKNVDCVNVTGRLMKSGSYYTYEDFTTKDFCISCANKIFKVKRNEK